MPSQPLNEVLFRLRKKKLKREVLENLRNQVFPLYILNKFPALAHMSYTDRATFRCTPLHWLLMDGRDQLLQQYPFVHAFCERRSDLAQLLRLRDAQGRIPIHLASQYCSTAVIEYLIEKDPESLSVCNNPGYLACQFAMANTNHPISLQLLKQMFEKHPNDANWGVTWGFALLTQQPVSVLKYMAEIFPKGNTSNQNLVLTGDAFIGLVRRRVPGTLRLEQARELTKVLKTFDSLILKPPGGWDPEAFIHIMEYLEYNQSKARLEFITLPSLIQGTGLRGRMLDAFQGMLHTNCRLTRLHMDTRDVVSCETWYKAIHDGVEARNFDHTLTVKMTTTWDGINILHDGGRPAATLEVHANGRGLGCVQSLSLVQFDYREEPFRQQLAMVPMVFSNLVQLYIEGSVGADTFKEFRSEVSSCLADFLVSTPALKTLVVWNVAIDPLPIFEVLKTHQSLLRLEVRSHSGEEQVMQDSDDQVAACLTMLEESNMTLQGCRPWSQANERIAYLLLLNQCGRKQAKNATEALALLESVLACRHIDILSLSPGGWGQSVWYDFFREDPGVWCHVAVQNAREGGPSFQEAAQLHKVQEQKTRKVYREPSCGVMNVGCGCWPWANRGSQN